MGTNTTEEVLRTSNGFYKRLVEAVTDYTYTVNIDNGHTDATLHGPGCIAVTGYAAEEYKADPFLWYRMVHEEDREAVLEHITKILSGQAVAPLEHRIIHKNGSIRWVKNTSILRYDDQGNLVAYDGLVSDITERKQIEESLARKVEINTAIAQLSTALIAQASIEDISFIVEQHAKQITGSKLGYVGYIDPKTGYLIVPTLSRDVWNQCRVHNKDVVFEKFTGLWGWVLNNRKSLVTNRPAEDPRSSGTPQGHISIHRFLSAPALIGETLVGQVAIANSNRDYTETDRHFVERLAGLYALAVQRKWAEEQIQKLSHAVEQSPSTVIITDREWNIEYVNPKFTQLTGYTSEEVLGKNHCILRADETLPGQYDQLWKTITSGSEWRGEFHSRKKNGELYWESASISPIRNDKGIITHFIVVKEDITRRKQSEEFVKSIFESISEGLIVVDREYRIIMANRAYCDQVRIPVENVIGKYCYEVSHHIDKPCDKAYEKCPCPVKSTFTTGQTHACFHTHYDKTGTPFYVEIKSYPMKDTTGCVTAAIEAITDVTKIVRLEKTLRNNIKELRESEEKFRKISITAQDAVIMCDSEGKISYWNPAAEKIFGYTEEEAYRKNLSELLIPDRLHKDYFKEFKKFKNIGQGTAVGKRLELPAINKKGREFPVELSLSAVRIKDKWHAIGIVRDITKRKQAEEKILRDYHMQNAINSILQISLQPITLEEQLDRILDIIISSPWLDVQPQSCIFLVEDDPEILVMKACHNFPTSFPKTCEKVPFGKCLCGRAASTGEIVFVDRCNGYHEMQRLNPSPHGHYCIPIISGHRVLGIINLYVNEGHKRNEEEEKFLSVVVNTLAGIIERKKAEEALKKSKDELELRVEERTNELTTTVDQLEKQIVERFRAEERIQASLREKEVLLSEIHHRVKNNLQVVSSLLYFQSKYTKDKEYQDIFKESRHRIKSMALIHEKLYQSKDLANIDFNDYVGSLINSLLRSYGMNTRKIILRKEIEDIFLGVDTAIPCGLIVNELVSNALKHAFPEDIEGEIKITVRLSDEDKIELTVGDNGVGMPEGLDFRHTDSLGLQLITNLTEHQLQGRIELLGNNGTEFRITFKELHHRRRF